MRELTDMEIEAVAGGFELPSGPGAVNLGIGFDWSVLGRLGVGPSVPVLAPIVIGPTIPLSGIGGGGLIQIGGISDEASGGS